MPTLNIDIYFDLVCPWCLIGKRNLDTAIKQLTGETPKLVIRKQWRPVQLLPALPDEGLPFKAFYLQRLGSEVAMQRRQAETRYHAAKANVELAFDRIRVMPNTAKAHRLLHHASNHLSEGQIETLLEDLFSAYFQRGENIGDSETLLQIASRRGLGVKDVARALSDKAPLPMTMRSNESEGVPLFVFDNRIPLAGAQGPHLLLAAMRDAVVDSLENRFQEISV